MSDYPASLDTRPLTTWPGVLTPAHQRTRSQFSAPPSSTLAELERELRVIGARHPVLEVAIPADQWRIDGRPRAQAKAGHPGVVLSLPHTAAGPLRFACDQYLTWQENLRAVVKTMEALRTVERYGAVRAREQYAGFKALPAGSRALVEPEMNLRTAMSLIYDLSGLTEPVELDSAYRAAVKRHHPDRGGRREDWDLLQRAKRSLEAAEVAA